MVKGLALLIEIGALGGIILMFAFISWTKVSLGAAVATLATFMPSSVSDKTVGSGSVKLLGATVSINSSLRIGLLLTGIIIILLDLTVAGKKGATYSSQAEVARRNIESVTSLKGAQNRASRIQELKAAKKSLIAMQELKHEPRFDTLLTSIDGLIKAEELTITVENIK